MLHLDEYFVLFTCGMSVVIALGLFLRPLNMRNILLALILLCLSYIQLGLLLIHTRLLYNFPHLIYTHAPFGYAISPLFFFYVTSFTHNKRSMALVDYVHFLPSLLLVGFSMPYLMLPVAEKITIIDEFYVGLTSFNLLVYASMIVFLVYAGILVFKMKRVFLKGNPVHVRLFKVFFLFFSWMLLILVLFAGLVFDLPLLWRTVNFIFSVEILLLYFALQRMPFLLSYGNLTVEKNKSSSRAVLSSIDTENLKKQILMLMEEEKLFCDEDLTLPRLAKAMEVSPHQLSAFLNEHFAKNFNSFVNSYRIAHACSLMKGDSAVSTLSLAFASGFNSYSAFYGAFKKETGKSPGEYKSEIKDG